MSESFNDRFYDNGYFNGQPYINGYHEHKPLAGGSVFFKEGKGGVYTAGTGHAHGGHNIGYELKKLGKKGFVTQGIGEAAGYKNGESVQGAGGM